MFLPKPTEGGDYELPPAGGPYLAVCYRYIDLGTQYSEAYQKSAHKVMIGWELVDEHDSKGRPFQIAKRYTFSMHEKAQLRKDLEAWRGMPFTDDQMGPGGFSTQRLLGVGCQIMVEHTQRGEKTYANVAAIMKAPRGVEVPRTTVQHEYLVLEPGKFDNGLWVSLSDGLRKIIEQSPEYRALNGQAPAPQSVFPSAQRAAPPPMRQPMQQNGAQTYAQAERALAPQRPPATNDGYSSGISEDDLDDEIPF